MIEFDYEKIMKDKVVVRCYTKDDGNNLLRWADSVGLTWVDGSKYGTGTHWSSYMNGSCYNLKGGTLGKYSYYKNKGFTILEYKDVVVNKPKILKIGEYEFDYVDGVELLKVVNNSIVGYFTDAKGDILPITWSLNGEVKLYPALTLVELNSIKLTPYQKLKPCPFCGGTAKVYQEDKDNEFTHRVKCNECWCSVSGVTNKQEAIDAWNRRV